MRSITTTTSTFGRISKLIKKLRLKELTKQELEHVKMIVRDNLNSYSQYDEIHRLERNVNLSKQQLQDHMLRVKSIKCDIVENKGLLQRKAYDSNYLENIPNKTPEDYQQITKLQKEMKDLKKQINKERKEYAKYIE